MPEENNNIEKIQSLREMIYTAERTLEGAKAMLLQLEGKKKVGRKKKASESEAGDRVVEGIFDGQIMTGMDGKQYPVPANYASKSKLIQGDLLKLNITEDGSFIYKQIGPAERKTLIGTVNQDPDGNYFITANGRAYKVLLASITYFKVEPGDEVALVVPRDAESDWGAIENVIHQAKKGFEAPKKMKNVFDLDKEEKELESTEENTEETKQPTPEEMAAVDEWAPDLEELEKELNASLNNSVNNNTNNKDDV